MSNKPNDTKNETTDRPLLENPIARKARLRQAQRHNSGDWDDRRDPINSFGRSRSRRR